MLLTATRFAGIRARGSAIRGDTREGNAMSTNAQVRHLWANQAKSGAKSGNGNFWFSGPVLYSYSTPIAHIVRAKDGSPVALITSRTYSVTTSGKHMPRTYDFPAELRNSYFYVPFLGVAGGRHGFEGSSLETVHGANVEHFAARYRDAVKRWEAINPNARQGWRKAESFTLETIAATLQGYAENQRKYARAFGIRKGLISDAQVKKDAAKVWARIDRLINDPALKAKREASARKRAAKLFAEQFGAAIRVAAMVSEWLEEDESALALKYFKHAEHVNGEHTYGLGNPFMYSRAWRDVDAFAPVIAKLERVRLLALPMLREAQRLEALANEEKLAAWLAGAPVHLPYSIATDANGSAYMRRVGNRIETSRGAEVLFSDAVKLFRFAKYQRAKHYAATLENVAGLSEGQPMTQNPVWKRNGARLSVSGFQLEEVYADGSCRVGCHFLSWARIAEAAKACDVFETEAADTTEHA